MTVGRVTLDSATVEFAARAMGSSLREAAAEACGPELLAVEAERLRRTVMQTRPVLQSRSPIRLALAAAAFFCAVVVGGYVAVDRQAPPLWVEAQTRQLQPNSAFVRVGVHHLVAPEGATSALRFSDGSRVTVESGARLRVQELLANGATLLLDKGRANVQVVHRNNDTRWSVVAGPFSVAVTGTRFDIAWNPATERLIVELQEGRVEITGPRYASPASLIGGQRFEALANEVGWNVTPLGMGTATTPASVVPVPRIASHREAASEASERRVSVAPPAYKVAAQKGLATASIGRSSEVATAAASNAAIVPAAAEGRQWSKLVAAGEFRQVTREADAMGLMVCLSQCSAPDLRALADASRYTGRLDTAEAALRVLHDRFPAQTSSAAYLLGAVDEARGRNANALRWYEEYLSRTSAGGFVAEARAARLRMLVATGGNGAARDAARQYLELYPHGASVGLATKVLESR